jgi:hypothetical protein
MLTGLHNQHPRSAIAYNAATEPQDIGTFYDTITEVH